MTCDLTSLFHPPLSTTAHLTTPLTPSTVSWDARDIPEYWTTFLLEPVMLATWRCNEFVFQLFKKFDFMKLKYFEFQSCYTAEYSKPIRVAIKIINNIN